MKQPPSDGGESDHDEAIEDEPAQIIADLIPGDLFLMRNERGVCLYYKRQIGPC